MFLLLTTFRVSSAEFHIDVKQPLQYVWVSHRCEEHGEEVDHSLHVETSLGRHTGCWQEHGAADCRQEHLGNKCTHGGRMANTIQINRWDYFLWASRVSEAVVSRGRRIRPELQLKNRVKNQEPLFLQKVWQVCVVVREWESVNCSPTLTCLTRPAVHFVPLKFKCPPLWPPCAASSLGSCLHTGGAQGEWVRVSVSQQRSVFKNVNNNHLHLHEVIFPNT